jgi:hypothetical protein
MRQLQSRYQEVRILSTVRGLDNGPPLRREYAAIESDEQASFSGGIKQLLSMINIQYRGVSIGT